MKMVWETLRILGDSTICINPTCVRVPVFYGHSEALHIETKKKITANEVNIIMVCRLFFFKCHLCLP